MIKNINMKAIAAMAKNRVIGNNGGLAWTPVREDFKWFKEFTLGNNIIVGSKTFDTLPLLKDRNVYVMMSPQAKTVNDIPEGDYGWYKNSNGCLAQRLNYISDVIYGIISTNVFGKESKWQLDLDKTIICGGAKIYESFFPYITELYVTHMNIEPIGDVYMPPFENLFSKTEEINELTGGHKIIKYIK